MIDIESLVFNTLYTAVIAYDSNIGMSSTYVEAPEEFPFVSCVEISNTSYSPSATLGDNENHSRVSYQIDIYSNQLATAKSECKGIANVVDSTMRGLGFLRTFSAQTPNIDRTLYRYTMRYEAVVAKPITVGNDTIYHTYN